MRWGARVMGGGVAQPIVFARNLREWPSSRTKMANAQEGPSARSTRAFSFTDKSWHHGHSACASHMRLKRRAAARTNTAGN